MAAAFDRAGFSATDVHMSDIIAGRVSLADFQGIAACGGFSYGDVLGAGEGWSKSILYNSRAFDEFSAFFNRNDSFGLGICNGCQMMSNLYQMIPGAAHWPRFVRNKSEQFEARFVMAEILESSSLFLDVMQGSMMPVVVAHGEGRIETRDCSAAELLERKLACMRYVDGAGEASEIYPLNPNGSELGLNGFTCIRLAADVGGTFTDVVLDTGETYFTSKIATTIETPETAILEGVQIVLQKAGIKPSQVTGFIHGTTLATNALIERKGARTALITTEGFRDSIEIAYENDDGRFTIMMPHPERIFRSVQNSWQVCPEVRASGVNTAHGCACSVTRGCG